MAALRADRTDGVRLAEAAAAWIGQDVDARLHELDVEHRKRKDSPLEARARERLREDLLALAGDWRRWADEARRRPTGRASHSEETRRLLGEKLEAADEALRALQGEPLLSAAATLAGEIVGEVAVGLRGRPVIDDALTLDMRLRDDVLLFEPCPSNASAEQWSEAEATAVLRAAAAVLDAPADYRSAFSRLLTAGRLPEAGRALAHLRSEGASVDGLEQQIEDACDERLDDFERRLQTLRSQVDDLLGADAEGQVDPGASLRVDGFQARLEAARAVGPGHAASLNLHAMDEELRELEASRAADADLLLAPLKARLAELAADGRDVAALDDLAAREDLTALREGLDSVRDGAELDGRREPEARLRAFAAFLPKIAKLAPEERNAADLERMAQERRDGPLAAFSTMEPEDAEAAQGLLRAWLALKQANKNGAEPVLRDLLSALRFREVKVVEVHPMEGGRWCAVRVRPTDDRADCPVPAFGSASGGELQVLVVEPAAVRDGSDLHRMVKGLARSSVLPTLVIYKAAMSPTLRRGFMVEARRRAGQEASALLDEAVIAFLAGLPGRRLSDLFAAALPGGGVQPYSDASGKTSPEMFFGRSKELASLWDPDGSCLVYGGRQLGKTALLEQVRLRHHRPPAEVVVYAAIQAEAELWPAVHRLLQEAGVPMPRHIGSRTVCDAVQEWLGEDGGRRIIVLIDEADTYLEHQMRRNYPEGGLIDVSNLMQRTQRRCKFVFAGLHNVQRLANTPNSPLLHFGDPLNIGPLVGMDLGEAREMVAAPMAAAGLVFERPGLPLHVLSRVAYYPSLLQTFGATLLARVNAKAHNLLTASQPLPVVVSGREVEAALEDRSFRSSVQEKFQKTLELDQRYRLITLAMANRALERRGSGAAPAMGDIEIQKLARDWWPQGFEEDANLRAFQGLLKEMVGLGVLIALPGERYAVRSAAIAAMLGGRDQIEHELVEFGQMSAPETPDTGALRRLDRHDKTPSPLTFRQEGLLLDPGRKAPTVHLLASSGALGQRELATSLAELQAHFGSDGAAELRVLSASYDTARQFAARLEEAAVAKAAGRRNLLVLSGPWLGRDMVDRALATAGLRGAGRRPLKVVIAPLTVDWGELDAADEHDRLWGAEVMSLTPLGRGGLRQWLTARLGTDPASAVVDRVRELTGGFPRFLEPLGRGRSDVLAAADSAFADRRANLPATLDFLGLSDARLHQAAQVVADYDTTRSADLEGEGVANPTAALRHLTRLGVLEDADRPGGGVLNPFVKTLLTSPPGA